jgi:ABC-type sugar transport system ATPase subunit
MADEILQLRGLTKRFGGLTAVDHVDMDVHPGEVIGLVGDNGAGKSTLIKMVSGVYHPVLDHAVMHGESQKVLKRLEIEIPSLRNLIKNLSGGQRQAVAIGRSIYWNARLLIMDEPTAALGVQEQRKVLDLVRLLRSQNIPIIIISHQMYDIFSVTDRLVVMRRGKKVAERVTKATNTEEVVGLITGAEEVERNGAATAPA